MIYDNDPVVFGEEKNIYVNANIPLVIHYLINQ